MAPKGSRSIRAREQEALDKVTAAPGTDGAPHITQFPDLVDVLPDMAKEYRRIHEQIGPLEARKKELGSEMKALMDASEAASIRGDGWVVTRSKDTKTYTLNPLKLLAKGVSAQILNDCTDEAPKAGYVQVKALEER